MILTFSFRSHLIPVSIPLPIDKSFIRSDLAIVLIHFLKLTVSRFVSTCGYQWWYKGSF